MLVQRGLPPRLYFEMYRRFFARGENAEWNHRIGDLFDWRVSAGPFRGMRYMGESHGSTFAPKLLGCYERQLHPIVESIIARKPRLIIDVGCAEGYYAVGMAVRTPGAQVLAFDTSDNARMACQTMARLNGVGDRVKVMGTCTPEYLASLDLTEAVIVCDCEGFEYKLMDGRSVPSLQKATMLIEEHPFFFDSPVPVLEEPFRSTHVIERIDDPSREFPKGWPGLEKLSAEDQQRAVDEGRRRRGVPTIQTWLYMRPR
ncbi:MAG: hypothetical protein U0Q16_10215 [Bryobacteraceae bacterium]